jgi:hypothetical protein
MEPLKQVQTGFADLNMTIKNLEKFYFNFFWEPHPKSCGFDFEDYFLFHNFPKNTIRLSIYDNIYDNIFLDSELVIKKNPDRDEQH